MEDDGATTDFCARRCDVSNPRDGPDSPIPAWVSPALTGPRRGSPPIKPEGGREKTTAGFAGDERNRRCERRHGGQQTGAFDPMRIHAAMIGHEYMLDHGAYPSTLGYRKYPKSLCTSVNEVICHGIPDDRPLQDGDIVNIDVTAYIGGVHGDTDATYLCGDVDERSRLLVQRTHEAMMRGIRASKPGREINVIGRVIQSYAKRFGYAVVRDFTGHGIGTAFHSGLVVPHYDAAPQYNTVIEPGMTFTIEPMLNLGTVEWDMWDDDWTVVTRDRQRSAQFEHTLFITDAGAEILTLP